jgi:hypothetical protein
MDFEAFIQLLNQGALTVLDDFFHCLGSRDLKSLRLCSKAWSNLVIPYLFTGQDALFISAHPSDLETFEVVVKNPDLRPRVHKIVWDDTTFDPRLVQPEFWHRFSPQDGEATSYVTLVGRDRYSRTDMSIAFERWAPIIRQHLHIRSNHLDIQALTKALPCLPNLKSIKLTTVLFHQHGRCRAYPAFSPDSNSPTARLIRSYPNFPLTHTPTNQWRQDQRRDDPQFLKIFTLDYLWLPDYEGLLCCSPSPHSSPFRGVLAILGAVSATPQLQLDELVIKSGYNDGYSSNGLSHWFFAPPAPPIDELVSRCKFLKSLTLSISGSDAHVVDEVPELNTYRQGRLTRLIRAGMKSLEHVYLDIESADPVSMMIGGTTNSDDPESQSITDISQANGHYPHLKSATFMYADISYTALLRFMRSHKSTLEFLRLEEVELVSGTWRQFLHVLRTDAELCLMFKTDSPDRERFELKLDLLSDNERHGYWRPNQFSGSQPGEPHTGDVVMEYIRREIDEYPLISSGGDTPELRMFD